MAGYGQASRSSTIEKVWLRRAGLLAWRAARFTGRQTAHDALHSAQSRYRQMAVTPFTGDRGGGGGGGGWVMSLATPAALPTVRTAEWEWRHTGGGQCVGWGGMWGPATLPQPGPFCRKGRKAGWGWGGGGGCLVLPASVSLCRLEGGVWRCVVRYAATTSHITIIGITMYTAGHLPYGNRW